MNAFDFVITIAIGSTFGRLITAKGVSLAESVTAFLVLITLQYIIAWLTVRSSRFANLVIANPSLLYFRGQFLSKAMKEQRVTQSEVLSAIRQNRIGSLQEVEAIILETAGTLAIIKKQKTEEPTDNSALSNIPEIN